MREPAPLLVLIGPERAVTVGEIDKGFVDFYAELFKEGDITRLLPNCLGSSRFSPSPPASFCASSSST